jgi:hypothetical protein
MAVEGRIVGVESTYLAPYKEKEDSVLHELLRVAKYNAWSHGLQDGQGLCIQDLPRLLDP